MSSTLHKVLHEWKHADPEDAKREIWEALGDISDIEIAGTQVLCAIYCRPGLTASGLWTPNQNEDIYQGTVALLVRLGNTAFNGATDWVDHPPRVGEWIYFRPQDSVMCSIKGPGSKMRESNRGHKLRNWEGWQCRLVYARDVYARVTLPHIIV